MSPRRSRCPPTCSCASSGPSPIWRAGTCAQLSSCEETNADSVRVDERTFPLDYEPTAALAYQLDESDVWARTFRFFIGDLLGERQASLVALSPHRPGRIPVVFVHGTASSAVRWADLVNDLLSDPRIRDNLSSGSSPTTPATPSSILPLGCGMPSGPRSNASTLRARTLRCAGWCWWGIVRGGC